MNRFGYRNDVEYYLISNSQGRVQIPEPIGFNDGNGNIYERDEKSKGFSIKSKDDLQFTGKGFDFWIKQIAISGVAENVILEKRAKDESRLDERWRTFPYLYLDPGTVTWDEEKKTCKVKSEDAGLKKIIDSKGNDSFDLVATNDVDGNIIDALSTETIYLEPREILRESEMEVEDGVEINAIVSGGDSLNARTFPFKFTKNSDSDNLFSAFGYELSAAGGDYANLGSGKTGNPFLQSSNEQKLLVLNGKVKVRIVNGNPGTMKMDIVFYEGGSDFNYNGSRTIPLVGSTSTLSGNIMEYEFNDFEISVNQGDTVAIGMLSNTSDGITYEVSETKVTITENSGEFQTASNARCLTYKQAFDRILYMMTGEKGLVVSELLESGIVKDDVITSGFWARQFPDVVNEGTDEERNIAFSLSFNDMIEHMEAMLPIAWWTEFNGQKELFRIEELKYTQQNFIGVPFTKKNASGNTIYVPASKIKRAVLAKNFYSTIELGSKIGGEGYEEVFGLQSICGKASFSTINKRNESTYSKLSPFALGDVDVELPRRKPFEFFSDEDTQYDSRIMCIRAKKVGNVYNVKKWQDTYEEPPTGIYRVGSAYNLELTPAQLLIDRHGYVINSGLYHHPNSKIVFADSNCNSAFISKKSGQDRIYEKPVKNSTVGLISVSILENPRIRPMTADLTNKVTQEIEDFMNGQTNGISNLYGLVPINTGQTIEYFRIIKSDANKEGQHKLIEAYII